MKDDFDQPCTRPGLCPVCNQRADIWDARLAVWECVYCNWFGKFPKQVAQ